MLTRPVTSNRLPRKGQGAPISSRVIFPLLYGNKLGGRDRGDSELPRSRGPNGSLQRNRLAIIRVVILLPGSTGKDMVQAFFIEADAVGTRHRRCGNRSDDPAQMVGRDHRLLRQIPRIALQG